MRVLWSREDVVRRGPKRPPIALGLGAGGAGHLRIGRTPGSADLSHLGPRARAVAPMLEVEVVDIVGPPVSSDPRGAVWVEVLAAVTALAAEASPPGTGRAEVAVPGAGRAVVSIGAEGGGDVQVEVWAGEVLCPVTLRSYVIGAVHQALGLVRSEGIAVDPDGTPIDLTIRSFGILSAREMPRVDVVLHDGDGWPVNGSDAVFAATVAAAWIAEGLPLDWPSRRRPRADRASRTGITLPSPSAQREEHP